MVTFDEGDGAARSDRARDRRQRRRRFREVLEEKAHEGVIEAGGPNRQSQHVGALEAHPHVGADPPGAYARAFRTSRSRDT